MASTTPSFPRASPTPSRCTRRLTGTSADPKGRLATLVRLRPAGHPRPAGRRRLRRGRGRLRPGLGRAQHRQPRTRCAGDHRRLHHLAAVHRAAPRSVPDTAGGRGGVVRARLRAPAWRDQPDHSSAAAFHLPAHVRAEPRARQLTFADFRVGLPLGHPLVRRQGPGVRQHRHPLCPADLAGGGNPAVGRACLPPEPIPHRPRDHRDRRGPRRRPARRHRPPARLRGHLRVGGRMRGRRGRPHRFDPGHHSDRGRAVHPAGVRGRPHGRGAGDATPGSDGAPAVIGAATSNRRWRRVFLIAGGILAAYALLAPLTSLEAAQSANVPLLADKLWFRSATIIAMFMVLATAWNIIGGITGYAAFGNVAFFGIGAYTTGMLIAKAKWPFLLALPLAPVVAAAFAALVGLPLLRLRGHYFAVASLGVGVAVGELVQNIDYGGQPVFGGASGLFLPILRIDNRGLFFFYLMSAAAMFSIGVTWWVLRSQFGYGLIAIRENEEAASVLGVNTTAYKVAAFALAAALTGLAGGIFSQWNVFINQDNVFPIEYNVQMILMALLGGTGTVFGPAAGAVLLQLLIQFLGGTLPISFDLPFVSSDARPIVAQVILGLLLVGVVIFVPRGVIDLFGGRTRLSLYYLRRSLRETSL